MLSLRILSLTLLASAVFGQSPDQVEYFEKNVRPLLVKNCQGCHNAKLQSGGVDLSSATGFQEAGLFKKDKPEASRILVVTSYEGSVKMPPMGKLKADDLAKLAEWCKMGAPWPGAAESKATSTAAKPADFTPEQKAFWAFQQRKDPAPPAVKNKAWVQNPIDQFILAKLEERGLKPAPKADKLTLLRRATLDLTGLPPTPDEIKAFEADQSPQAYAKLIDRLLASPRYGERWGRHWLDVARYADSTGNDEDHRYPYAFRYRDYVIQAFNDDMPYSQFVREQLAGDLMSGNTEDKFNKRAITATGFLALGAKALAQQDKKKMLYDVYDEQVDVVSKAFLGMTMACARCHNHKFDPILTRDYYSLTGMFASTKSFAKPDAFVSEMLLKPLVPEAKYKQYQKEQAHLKSLKFAVDEYAEQQVQAHSHEMAAKLAAYLTAARDPKASREGLDEAIVKRLAGMITNPKAKEHWAELAKASVEDVPKIAAKMQADAEKALKTWDTELDKWREKARKVPADSDMAPPEKPKFDAKKSPVVNELFMGNGIFAVAEKQQEKIFPPAAFAKLGDLKKIYDDFKKQAMPEPDMADAVEEDKPVHQKVLIRGDLNNPGEDAPVAVPAILSSYNPPKQFQGSGRMEFAGWLVDPANPLPSRVMVNRIWSWHFGEGIVRSVDNFGKTGERPDNLELLDYLANRFIQNGWSVKQLTKAIMLSNTYQMAAETEDKAYTVDPENRMLSRFNRQRMSVEQLRDSMLFISGKLDETMGGTLQSGFGTDGENSSGRLSMKPEALTRRTVYVPLRRANLPNMMNLFDFGDATTVNGHRSLTNVAPQALFMMNSGFVEQRSSELAKTVFAAASDPRERINQAFVRILNRKPSGEEADRALTYISNMQERFKEPEAKAWQSFCQILFSSNEFIYIE